jgi:hypothetical protein
MTTADELKSDDHRQALTAMRNILADHLIAADPNVSAQIAARLQAVLAELAAMPAVKELSVIDELRAERDRRRKSS